MLQRRQDAIALFIVCSCMDFLARERVLDRAHNTMELDHFNSTQTLSRDTSTSMISNATHMQLTLNRTLVRI